METRALVMPWRLNLTSLSARFHEFAKVTSQAELSLQISNLQTTQLHQQEQEDVKV